MLHRFKALLGIVLIQFTFMTVSAQYKSFKISVNGDTLNAVDQENQKQGKWLIHVDALRGERGYEEEGVYIDDKKEGPWRKYTLSGDFIALENYRFGDKDGTCQYFSAFGDLLREENWRAYNPNAPYDTIPVYGTGNNEIIDYKIVKADPYSVKHGNWTYYDPATGRILKTETYDRNRLLQVPKSDFVSEDEPMKKIKPKEVLEYDKKNSGRKKVRVRDGRTGT